MITVFHPMDTPNPKYKELLDKYSKDRIKEELYSFVGDCESRGRIDRLIKPWALYIEELINIIAPGFINDLLLYKTREQLNFAIDRLFLNAIKESEDKSNNYFIECLKEEIKDFINQNKFKGPEIEDFNFV